MACELNLNTKKQSETLEVSAGRNMLSSGHDMGTQCQVSMENSHVIGV